MFDFSTKLHFSCMRQLFYNWCKCNSQLAPTLQLMYEVDINDHAKSTHFHHPLNMTLATSCQLSFPLI